MQAPKEPRVEAPKAPRGRGLGGGYAASPNLFLNFLQEKGLFWCVLDAIFWQISTSMGFK